MDHHTMGLWEEPSHFTPPKNRCWRLVEEWVLLGYFQDLEISQAGVCWLWSSSFAVTVSTERHYYRMWTYVSALQVGFRTSKDWMIVLAIYRIFCSSFKRNYYFSSFIHWPRQLHLWTGTTWYIWTAHNQGTDRTKSALVGQCFSIRGCEPLTQEVSTVPLKRWCVQSVCPVPDPY
jgi:hypothetical protein